jgi:hypothetical protein
MVFIAGNPLIAAFPDQASILHKQSLSPLSTKHRHKKAQKIPCLVSNVHQTLA